MGWAIACADLAGCTLLPVCQILKFTILTELTCSIEIAGLKDPLACATSTDDWVDPHAQVTQHYMWHVIMVMPEVLHPGI